MTAASIIPLFYFSEKKTFLQMGDQKEAERDAHDREVNRQIAEIYVKTKGVKPPFDSLKLVPETSEIYFDTAWGFLADDKDLLKECLKRPCGCSSTTRNS